MSQARRALITRGGWDGHNPIEATNRFVPFLEQNGFHVTVEDTVDIYAHPVLPEFDLIVQCVTMSTITDEQVAGLRAAVEAGTGFTGWHGGIADSFRNSSDYLQLVGGQFATHPAKAPDERTGDGDYDLTYEVELTDLGRSHPITAGLADFTLTSEQYWVLHDDLIDVLARTVHPARPWQPWHRPVTSPAVWTREWGRGRIVVTTPGHSVEVLDHPTVRTIVERGMLWAARTASDSSE